MTNMVSTIKTPRFLVALNVLCVTFLLISVISQNCLLSLGNGYVCATVFTYPITCLLLDIIAEIYGYQEAKKTLILIILARIIFVLIITLFILLPKTTFWYVYSNAFDTIMHPLLRMAVIPN